LADIQAIRDVDRLASYPIYHATLGELEHRAGSTASAIEHFRAAEALARNPSERRFFEKRISACEDEAPVSLRRASRAMRKS
jgi:predicted RNA polymerase sigma factor